MFLADFAPLIVLRRRNGGKLPLKEPRKFTIPGKVDTFKVWNCCSTRFRLSGQVTFCDSSMYPIPLKMFIQQQNIYVLIMEVSQRMPSNFLAKLLSVDQMFNLYEICGHNLPMFWKDICIRGGETGVNLSIKLVDFKARFLLCGCKYLCQSLTLEDSVFC